MLDVTLSHDKIRPLIANGYLTNNLELYLFYISRDIIPITVPVIGIIGIMSLLSNSVLKKINNVENPDKWWYFATIVTCTYCADKLYHFDDITKFLESLDSVNAKHSSLNMSISKIPYLKIEILKRSGRIFHKHFLLTFLNDLQWLHIRTLPTPQVRL